MVKKNRIFYKSLFFISLIDSYQEVMPKIEVGISKREIISVIFFLFTTYSLNIKKLKFSKNDEDIKQKINGFSLKIYFYI